MHKIEYKLSLMMFLEWFIWGAWFVPLWQLLNHYHFSPVQIGWCFACTAIGAIVSPVLIGTLADRFIAAEKLLSAMMLLGAILLYFTAQQTTFGYFFILLLGYALTYMPTIALTNSITFMHVNNSEHLFPRIRVMGTLGWIAAGTLCGFLPSWLGLSDISDTTIPLLISAGTSLIFALFALTLPKSPPSKSVPIKTKLIDKFNLSALMLLKDRHFLIFFICSFLFSMPLAFYYIFANGYLKEIGMRNPTGWMSLGQYSEIFFMLVLPFFIKRFGIKTVLLLGLTTAALRYLLFMYGGAENYFHYSLLFIAILLHGVSYDFYFVSASIYVDQKAPQAMRTAAQGLIILACQGIGSLLGYQLGGHLMEKLFTYPVPQHGLTFNWYGMWLFGAIMIMVITLIMAIFYKEKPLNQYTKNQPQLI